MAKKTTTTRKPAKKAPKRPKMKIAKSEFSTIYRAIGIGVVIAVLIIIIQQCDTEKTPEIPESYCGCATAPITSKTSFHDINPEQLAHAKTNGLKKPIRDKAEFEELKDSLIHHSQLVSVRSNRYYRVQTLTHSLPYLTPDAAELLNEIGKRFQHNLKKAGLPSYKFHISSLLRTVEFQKQLTHVNVNATPNETAHYYGTTFDIAYNQYNRRLKSVVDERVEKVLVETLEELREQCRLMIIREKSNKCFHITVVNKKEK